MLSISLQPIVYRMVLVGTSVYEIPDISSSQPQVTCDIEKHVSVPFVRMEQACVYSTRIQVASDTLPDRKSKLLTSKYQQQYSNTIASLHYYILACEKLLFFGGFLLPWLVKLA